MTAYSSCSPRRPCSSWRCCWRSERPSGTYGSPGCTSGRQRCSSPPSGVSVGRGGRVNLEIPEVVGTFGLVLFTYTIGVVSGTHFFASLRRGWPAMLVVAGAFALVAALAVVRRPRPRARVRHRRRRLRGGLTNTPALAAASARAADPAAPTIGYSITYLGGVVVMLVVAAWALRRPGAEPPP